MLCVFGEDLAEKSVRSAMRSSGEGIECPRGEAEVQGLLHRPSVHQRMPRSLRQSCWLAGQLTVLTSLTLVASQLGRKRSSPRRICSSGALCVPVLGNCSFDDVRNLGFRVYSGRMLCADSLLVVAEFSLHGAMRKGMRAWWKFRLLWRGTEMQQSSKLRC